MTSLSKPNMSAVWSLHTLSTRECSSNERLRPRGRGCTPIYSYIRRLGSFVWAQNLEFQYFLGIFRRMICLFLFVFFLFFFGGGGMKNNFLGGA